MYKGTKFEVDKYDGSKIAAVVLAEVVWKGESYAVVGYEDDAPNVFLWSLDTLEDLVA